LAAAIRLPRATYGVADPCLAVPAEYWLYEQPQPASLYAWNQIAPGVFRTYPEGVPGRRALADTPDSLAMLRLLSLLVGLLTPAFAMTAARRFAPALWPLIGVLVAVLPPFVSADRWLTPYDLAALCVAACLASLSRPLLATFSALALFIVAPPLWWLATALLILRPVRQWRVTIFMAAAGIVAIPAFQSPYWWLESAARWDSGTTAACILAGALLAAWYGRTWRIRAWVQGGIAAAAILIGGGISLIEVFQLPVPTPQTQELIAYLRDRVPDEAIVRFDGATAPLAAVITCPMGDTRRVSVQTERVAMPFLGGSRPEYPPPDYVVRQAAELDGKPYSARIAGMYTVRRMVNVPNPVEVSFGGVFALIGSQIVTESVVAGGVADVRLDFQFGPAVTVEALRYALFIHVTRVGQPGEKVVDYSVGAFMGEMSSFAPRAYALNQRYRFAVPPDVPPGQYDVLIGAFDGYTGGRLSTPLGDFVRIGTLTVR
jgi:hypothetical protein